MASCNDDQCCLSSHKPDGASTKGDSTKKTPGMLELVDWNQTDSCESAYCIAL